MDDVEIIEKLMDIIVELDARECSNNSVIMELSGTGWTKLCEDGIKLFERLK